MLGWYVRRLAEGGLVAALTATSPARLAHPAGGEPLAGTNPLAIAIPSSDGRPARRRRLDGSGHVRRRAARRGPSGGARPLRRRAGAQGVRARARPGAARRSARRTRASAPSSSSPGPRPTRSRSCAAAPPGYGSPATRRLAPDRRPRRPTSRSSGRARARGRGSTRASSSRPAARVDARAVVEEWRMLGLLRQPAVDLGDAPRRSHLRRAFGYAAKKYSQAEISCRPGLPPRASTVVPASSAARSASPSDRGGRPPSPRGHRPRRRRARTSPGR